jgi:hypothetical protein
MVQTLLSGPTECGGHAAAWVGWAAHRQNFCLWSMQRLYAGAAATTRRGGMAVIRTQCVTAETPKPTNQA